jgi:hypothetical protein
MTGVDEENVHKTFEDVEDRLPVHAGTLDGHMGTALVQQPIRSAQQLIGHGRERAALLLVLLEEACHHGRGVDIEATATLVDDLPCVLLSATA